MGQNSHCVSLSQRFLRSEAAAKSIRIESANFVVVKQRVRAASKTASSAEAEASDFFVKNYTMNNYVRFCP